MKVFKEIRKYVLATLRQGKPLRAAKERESILCGEWMAVPPGSWKPGSLMCPGANGKIFKPNLREDIDFYTF